jgi:hypothetical protein
LSKWCKRFTILTYHGISWWRSANKVRIESFTAFTLVEVGLVRDHTHATFRTLVLLSGKFKQKVTLNNLFRLRLY